MENAPETTPRAERPAVLEGQKKEGTQLQLIPLSPQLIPVQPYQEEDMRDRSLLTPPYNPDDLFAFPFPYVPPLTHEVIDKRLRESRVQSQGDVYRRLFRDLVRPSPAEEEDENFPCGSCPCCQRMLSYVSTLRTVLDHMVADIVLKSPAGTRQTPCVLCLQEHKEHSSHLGDTENSQSIVETGDSISTQSPENYSTGTGDGMKRKTSQGGRSTTAVRPDPKSSTPWTAQDSMLQASQRKESTSGLVNDPVRFARDRAELQYDQGRVSLTQDQQNVLDQRARSDTNEKPVPHDQRHEQEVRIPIEGRPSSPQSIHVFNQIPVSQSTTVNQTSGAQTVFNANRTTATVPKNDSAVNPPKAQHRPTSLVQPLVKTNGDHTDDQTLDQSHATWRDARAELLKPPELSPREASSPTAIHSDQYFQISDQATSQRSEAYVTMATDNLSALCCLVLGNSLLLAQTTKMLAVIVTDGVSALLRQQLQNVFDVVQGVGVMDSQGSTKLALLEQPELGVSFTKLYIWALDQFSKCVFLDFNTLVVQNCDELFERQELSAVPDIGWPDCFNSGVFVFAPSQDTFWRLIHYAEQQDSFDGGDQGLLNIFFRNWASDISRKLPFLYNLMANVSYTYKPAFKQFGKGVKIVQFFGSYKPWNVQFHPRTGQMAPGANVHPTYAQFVHFWLEIYTKRVLPFFSKEIQEHMCSRDYACPHEVLQFVPSPVRQQESLPTQPSYRVYSGDKTREQPSVLESVLQLIPQKGTLEPKVNDGPKPDDVLVGGIKPSEQELQTIGEPEVDPDVIPGVEMDDYGNMAAWEQGRMDYLGNAASDNIIRRLDFLIRGTK